MQKKGINWRRWNNILHRDLGYLAVALTVVYGVSGIAVNHLHDWNPNYRIQRQDMSFDPVPIGDRSTMVAALVERLDLPPDFVDSFRPSPEVVQIFYDGWSVEANAAEGKAVIERPRERALLRDFNFLHLNHPKGLWTFVADFYAGLLVFLAISGLFVLKGPKGLAGRGKWLLLAGAAVPLGFLLALRYLA